MLHYSNTVKNSAIICYIIQTLWKTVPFYATFVNHCVKQVTLYSTFLTTGKQCHCMLHVSSTVKNSLIICCINYCNYFI